MQIQLTQNNTLPLAGRGRAASLNSITSSAQPSLSTSLPLGSYDNKKPAEVKKHSIYLP